MRMCVDLHLNAYFLVISNLIIVNFSTVSGPRNQHTSFLILRYDIESYMRFALSIHLGVHTQPILLILQQVVLHYLGQAILHLYSYLAVYDLIVDHVADVAEEGREASGNAVCYIVVLDGATEGTVQHYAVSAV